MKKIVIEHMDGRESHLPVHHISFTRKGQVLMVVGPDGKDTFFPLINVRCWEFVPVHEDPKPTTPMGIAMTGALAGQTVDVNLDTGKVTGVSFITDRMTSQPVTQPLTLKPGRVQVISPETAMKHTLPPGRYLSVRPHVTLEGTCIGCYRGLSSNPGCITMPDGSTVHAIPQ